MTIVRPVQADVDAFNDRYAGFHDGFIKGISLVDNSKFLRDMPWEEQRQFTDNVSSLHAAGHLTMNGKMAFISLRHFNYDWPNQPYNRSIELWVSKVADIASVWPEILGVNIFSLKLLLSNDRLALHLWWHRNIPASRYCTLDNADQALLITGDRMRVTERTKA